MKINISLSAKRLSANLLVDNIIGTFHGGMQKVSRIGSVEYLWNYVAVKNGKTEVVFDKEDAVGVVCQGKLYKFGN